MLFITCAFSLENMLCQINMHSLLFTTCVKIENVYDVSDQSTTKPINRR